MVKKDEDGYFLSDYEKHLLKNGAIPDFGQTTEEQRVKDLKELLEVIDKKGGKK